MNDTVAKHQTIHDEIETEVRNLEVSKPPRKTWKVVAFFVVLVLAGICARAFWPTAASGPVHSETAIVK